MDRIQTDREAGRITPQTVADFAWLFMETEEGRPIQPFPHHKLWLDLWCDQDIKNLLIIAPPESAKTTWLAAYVAVNIAFWPERPRIYAGSAGVVATRRSLAIRTLLERPEIQEVFPGLQRTVGMAHEAHQWSFSYGPEPYAGRIHPTLSSYGADGSITGSRAQEAVGDDILNEKNTRTAYMREQINKWFHLSFMSRVMAQTGRALLIGNAFHADDLYQRLKKAGGWVVVTMPMLAEQADYFAHIYYPPDFPGQRLGEPISEADSIGVME